MATRKKSNEIPTVTPAVQQPPERPVIEIETPATPSRWDDPPVTSSRVSAAMSSRKSNGKGTPGKVGTGKSTGKHKVGGGGGGPSRHKKSAKKKVPIKPKMDSSKNSFFRKK